MARRAAFAMKVRADPDAAWVGDGVAAMKYPTSEFHHADDEATTFIGFTASIPYFEPPERVQSACSEISAYMLANRPSTRIVEVERLLQLKHQTGLTYLQIAADVLAGVKTANVLDIMVGESERSLSFLINEAKFLKNCMGGGGFVVCEEDSFPKYKGVHYIV